VKRFEVIVFVDSDTLRHAKATLREFIFIWIGAEDFCNDIIADLKEVKRDDQR